MKDPLVRKKSSESHKGKKQSIEQRLKQSIRQKGKFVSEETKRKTSESVKKLWQDPEFIAKTAAGYKYRPVVAYDKEGNLICEYGSLKDADQSTGVDFRNIQACCKGRKKTAGGFVWKYADEQVNTEVSAETKASA